MQTECQAMLEEKEREVDNDKAKMTRRLRDSGQRMWRLLKRCISCIHKLQLMVAAYVSTAVREGERLVQRMPSVN